MTEGEAKAWIECHFGSSAIARLEPLVRLVREEAKRQNLVAPSTLDTMWSRHIADSAQLVLLAERRDGQWVDIGTGAGFPGMVVALLRDAPVELIEPRRLRADFLERVATALCLHHVQVRQQRAEAVQTNADVVSARAVASVSSLIAMARPWASAQTLWLLPRGRYDVQVGGMVKEAGVMFHVKHSVTDPASVILQSVVS